MARLSADEEVGEAGHGERRLFDRFEQKQHEDWSRTVQDGVAFDFCDGSGIQATVQELPDISPQFPDVSRCVRYSEAQLAVSTS